MYTFQTSDIWDMSIFGCMHKNIFFLQQPQFFNDQWNQRAEINNEKKFHVPVVILLDWAMYSRMDQIKFVEESKKYPFVTHQTKP